MRGFTKIVTLTALISLGVLSGNINAWAHTPAPAFNKVPVNATTSNTDLAIVDYVLVEKKRVSRTDFNYTYRASIINSGAAIRNATATLSGSSGVTTVVDGTLTFGFLGQGDTVSSTDTFTIRQNRRHPFNPQTLSWAVDYDSCAYPELFAPELVAPLLGGNTAAISLPVCYSGLQTLTFHLIEGPPGMSIDPVTGVIIWTPPLSLAGQEAAVKATVTAGATVSQVEFGLPVASETPIETSTTADRVTVTEPGNLQGLSFILPVEVSESITVSVLDENQVPRLPEGVQRLTDIFRTSPAQSDGDPIKVKLPAVDLPDGHFPFELILFVYTEVYANTAADENYIWASSQTNITMNEDGTATIDLWGVGEAAFIGLRAPDSSSTPPPAPLELASFANFSVNVTCKAKVYPIRTVSPTGYPVIIDTPNDNHQVCTVPGDLNFEVLVKDFQRNKWDPATTIEELVGWLYQARPAFTALGLEYDDNFEVMIEPMQLIGAVRVAESYKTLHLDADKHAKNLMQAGAVHEYFHQAQSRTRVSGQTNLLSWHSVLRGIQDKGLWVVEGTAMWFQDELFDSTDSYEYSVNNPMSKILNRGFNAEGNAAFPHETNPYARFGMWKLIYNKCPGFQLVDILNIDSLSDSTGIKNLSQKLNEWNCRFTTGFGEENVSTLAGALLHYQYATVKKDNIELLDSDEDKIKFHFETTPTARFSPGVGTSTIPFGIPANGARSFYLEEVPVVDAGQEAFIRAQTSGDKALVSLIENEFDIADWIEVPAQTEYGYGHDGTAPKLFVTVVNPSTTDPISVSFEVGIRSYGSPTASLEAIPSSIEIGESTTLNWSSTNSSSCAGEGFSTSDSTSGSVSVSPVETTTYTVTCTGVGGSETATATVTVGSAPPSTGYLTFEEGNPGTENDGLYIYSSQEGFSTWSVTAEPKPLIGTDGVTITVITRLPNDDEYAQIYYEFGYQGTQCLVLIQDNDAVRPSNVYTEATYYSYDVLSTLTDAVRQGFSTGGASITKLEGCSQADATKMYFNRIEFLKFNQTPIGLDAAIIDSGYVDRF